MSPLTPKRILAIKIRAMGDTILMTASLDELKRTFPHSEIDVLVLKQWAPLLEAHPVVNRIWTYEKHRDRAARAKAIARMAIHLRRARYDCVVNFHASPSSATMAFATGAKLRSIHFHGHTHKNRYSTVEIPGKGIVKPVIERDLDSIRALGVPIREMPLPRIVLKPEERRLASQRLSRLGLTSPLLALGLGASRPTKAWDIERFVELAIGWSQSTDGGVLAFASADEAELAKRFLKEVERRVGERIADHREAELLRSRITCEIGLPIRTVGALLERSAVFMGNDSGPKHLAVAVGVPTVTAFGPEDPFEWHPYPQEKHRVLFTRDLPCRSDALPGLPPWCGLHTCTIEQHRCMTTIGVPEVLSNCLEVKRGA